MELALVTRRAITRALAVKYRDASKELKGEILDTVCGLTGYHRDYARRALRAALRPRPVAARASRAPKYDAEVVAALGKCWAVLNAPAGKRLAPMLAELVELVPLLRRYGELDLDDAAAGLLPGCCRAAAGLLPGCCRAAGGDVAGHDRPQAGTGPGEDAAAWPLAHQAGVDAEVEDRDADLGRARRGHPGGRGGRPGRPRGRQRRRPVLFHPDRDRHRDRVDREPDRAGQAADPRGRSTWSRRSARW
jgi:hypothetical protein